MAVQRLHSAGLCLGHFCSSLNRDLDLPANVIKRIHGKEALLRQVLSTRLIALILVTMSSQNVVPVHIAFIPILIPPLRRFFEAQSDRRMIACVLTFGL